MHSIVTTFREAVIVEVANFGAAMDTLIDQYGGLTEAAHFCQVCMDFHKLRCLSA